MPGYPATGEHAQVSSFQDQPDRIAVSMLTHLRAAARRLLPHGEVILFYRIRPCLSRGERGRGKRRDLGAVPPHFVGQEPFPASVPPQNGFLHMSGARIFFFTETMSAFLDIRGAMCEKRQYPGDVPREGTATLCGGNAISYCNTMVLQNRPQIRPVIAIPHGILWKKCKCRALQWFAAYRGRKPCPCPCKCWGRTCRRRR